MPGARDSRKRLTVKGHERTFGVIELFLDCGSGYMTVCSSKFIELQHLKRVNLLFINYAASVTSKKKMMRDKEDVWRERKAMIPGKCFQRSNNGNYESFTDLSCSARAQLSSEVRC